MDIAGRVIGVGVEVGQQVTVGPGDRGVVSRVDDDLREGDRLVALVHDLDGEHATVEADDVHDEVSRYACIGPWGTG